MDGGPESRCVGRVYGAATLTSSARDDGRMRPKHVEIKKFQQIALLHLVGISLYFIPERCYVCNRLTGVIVRVL